VAVAADQSPRRPMHPLHAILLAATIPLFLGALLSDVAYAQTYEIQWTNFASWLLAGGLVIAAVALVCAIVDLCRADRRSARLLIYTLLLAIVWVLGFIDALVHGKDAWAAMPAGLVLSLIVTVLACTAKWIVLAGLPFSAPRSAELS